MTHENAFADGTLRSIRLDGKITLLSPMSHIGESLGPDSYLATDTLIGPDGMPCEVTLYSGNAFRGHLRDCGAVYLSNKLGGMRYSPDVFYLLFSGGALSGLQVVDIDMARAYRRSLPFLSVFGGAVGSQILPGKIKVGAMYPLVAECQRVLPAHLRQDKPPSWKRWTYEKSFTRTDDAKNEILRRHLLDTAQTAVPIEAPPEYLASGEPGEEEKDHKGGRRQKEARKRESMPQQMRYSVEMLAAGAVLYQRIDLCDMTDLEVGAFVSALAEFSKHPYIGGKSGTGCGLVEIEYDWRPVGAAKPEGRFLAISASDCLWLSRPAEEAKGKYDDFLIRLYEQYLEDHAPELKSLLAGADV